MAATRPYQIVVWGATGFTGQLVCEHIATQYHGKIQWAMAGRNRGKLETVRSNLAEIQNICKDVPILTADSGDQRSVDQMVAQTDVIIACAGPFSKYSTPVVDASVRLGTHYCDITGETLWVREMIEKYHEQAKENKVKIVHCCGYDSVPLDLGTLFVVDYVRKTYNAGCKKIEAFIEDTYGGFSGGTLYTMMDMASNMTAEKAKIVNDPYNLVPLNSRHGEDVPAVYRPTFSENAGTWAAPSIMELVNTRIARRSNALLDSLYGGPINLSETTKCSNLFYAVCGSLLIVGFGAVLGLSPGRALAQKFLPQPGQGPSKEVQRNGKFAYRFVAETSDNGKKKIVQAMLSAKGYDPGYWGTSRMILECALCQVLDSAKLKDSSTLEGGVLTPASAFGLVAIDRLQQAGITFKILES